MVITNEVLYETDTEDNESSIQFEDHYEEQLNKTPRKIRKKRISDTIKTKSKISSNILNSPLPFKSKSGKTIETNVTRKAAKTNKHTSFKDYFSSASPKIGKKTERDVSLRNVKLVDEQQSITNYFSNKKKQRANDPLQIDTDEESIEEEIIEDSSFKVVQDEFSQDNSNSMDQFIVDDSQDILPSQDHIDDLRLKKVGVDHENLLATYVQFVFKGLCHTPFVEQLESLYREEHWEQKVLERNFLPAIRSFSDWIVSSQDKFISSTWKGHFLHQLKQCSHLKMSYILADTKKRKITKCVGCHKESKFFFQFGGNLYDDEELKNFFELTPESEIIPFADEPFCLSKGCAQHVLLYHAWHHFKFHIIVLVKEVEIRAKAQWTRRRRSFNKEDFIDATLSHELPELISKIVAYGKYLDDHSKWAHSERFVWGKDDHFIHDFNVKCNEAARFILKCKKEGVVHLEEVKEKPIEKPVIVTLSPLKRSPSRTRKRRKQLTIAQTLGRSKHRSKHRRTKMPSPKNDDSSSEEEIVFTS
mmetsp:Transcript_9592/g.14164  ORF Transcript_9592/g.14164 Transcript_9592/m.14164 type:complete len:531 (-) Transcript_9592:549-2141(-)